jgi:hypothetical protein
MCNKKQTANLAPNSVGVSGPNKTVNAKTSGGLKVHAKGQTVCAKEYAGIKIYYF